MGRGCLRRRHIRVWWWPLGGWQQGSPLLPRVWRMVPASGVAEGLSHLVRSLRRMPGSGWVGSWWQGHRGHPRWVLSSESTENWPYAFSAPRLARLARLAHLASLKRSRCSVIIYLVNEQEGSRVRIGNSMWAGSCGGVACGRRQRIREGSQGTGGHLSKDGGQGKAQGGPGSRGEGRRRGEGVGDEAGARDPGLRAPCTCGFCQMYSFLYPINLLTLLRTKALLSLQPQSFSTPNYPSPLLLVCVTLNIPTSQTVPC